MWDAEQYLKFEQERARPFHDLLARLPRDRVDRVADLGCGAGNLTRLLADRWPTAQIIGVDTSAEMLAKARSLELPGRLTFVQDDIAHWESDHALNVIVSNAAIQWVSEHDRLLRGLVAKLAPGGVLAVQVPSMIEMPGRLVVAAATAAPRWRDKLQGAGLRTESVHSLAWYVRLLLDLGLTVDAWETTYYHVLSSEDPVLEWMKGTALRPLLKLLDKNEAPEFLKEVSAGLRAAYPPEQGTTVFPFPRLFFVGRRRESI